MDIKEVQELLAKIRVDFIGAPTGVVDTNTTMAIREFQRYARLKQIARENPMGSGGYVDRLEPFTNPDPYPGFAHGVADDETTKRLKLWADNNLRCPLVIQAWSLKKNPEKKPACKIRMVPDELLEDCENLWLSRELDDSSPRVFAFDFSGYYVPLALTERPKKIVVGTFVDFAGGGGPSAEAPNHVLTGDPKDKTKLGAEIRPELLVGKPLDMLDGNERSTFKVVRAVSEVEPYGYFDSLTSYDDTIVSLGPYHWTLGLSNKLEKAELPAYFAFLAATNSDAFKLTIASWGVGALDEWGPDGAKLFDPSARKFVSTFGHMNKDGKLVAISQGEAVYYRSWHWFYRFQAAGRYSDGFRLGMWDMARFRLRELLATPFSKFAGSQLPDKTTVGDIYTSERAIALLLRWHVNKPSHVILGGKTGDKLNEAFKLAKLKGAPSTWKGDPEKALIQGIKSRIKRLLPDKPKTKKTKRRNDRLQKTTEEVDGWPRWAKRNPFCFRLDPSIGRLSAKRGSFHFAVPKTAVGDTTANAVKSPEDFALPSKAATAASDRVVLVGLIGELRPPFDAPAYKVTSNGFELTESGNPKGIDRIVLFNANESPAKGELYPPALVAIPILPKTVDKIGVVDAGLDSTLVIKAKFRCWMTGTPGEQTQQVDWAITHKKESTERRTLIFRRLNFPGFGDDTAVSDPPIQTLPDHHFTDTPPTPFPMPVLPDAIGLRLAGNELRPRRTLRFVPLPPSAPTADCAAPESQSSSSVGATLVTIEIAGTYSLTAATQRIDPFPLTFEPSEMPSQGAQRVIPLAMRQPFGMSWQHGGDPEWILECQFPEPRALKFWNDAVTTPVVESIDVIQRGRPASLLPFFTNPKASETRLWLARYAVYDLNGQPDVGSKLVVKLPGVVRTAGFVNIVPRLLTPLPLSANATPSVVDVTLPRLLRSDAASETSAVPLSCRLALHDRRDDESADPLSASIRFGVLQAPPPPMTGDHDLQRVRMGALDLDFPPASGDGDVAMPDTVEAESLLLAIFGVDGGSLKGVATREVAYSLKIARIGPGGQDDVPGSEFATDLGATVASGEEYARAFARPPALLVTPASPPPKFSPFYLTVREVTARDRSQSIDLRLRSSRDTGEVFSAASIIVVDTDPFLVAQVRLGIVESGLALTSEIGNWSTRAGEGAGWELNAGASGFDLALPPQGVGEEMHRRRGAGDILPDPDPQRPGEFLPIDFRFTPPTVASLRASFFRQRFAEAPWNLRRVLGFAGQRAPGAGVDRIRFEMLYGMRGEITYPFLRLAEIGSLLGAQIGQQPPLLPWAFSLDQCRQYSAFRDSWRSLYRVLQTRLGVLEPYDDNQPNGLMLRESDGLSFELRKGADLRYPVSIDPNTLPNPDIPREGIAGSFAWAFESRNIYEAVWRNRTAKTAQIWRPFFSALGGWGQQKATFDNGRSSIICDISMGRVSTLNVERLGRISVYGNRARHVIVYQRTVAPTRQFFLEQESFHGNPLLRKVEEYVEILEEERGFPDGTAEAVTRAGLLACSFAGSRPPRIHVNSRWGQDIGATGWKIPLWVRGAAPADVYPQPTIHQMWASPEGGGLRVPVPIDEPELLYFYTNTDPNFGDDTNEWPLVVGLDIGIVPPNDSTTFAAGKSGGPLAPPDRPTTSNPGDFHSVDSFVPTGLRAFTTALGPSAKPVNLVAERASGPIAAALQNVTVARGVIQQALGDYDSLTKLEDLLANAIGPVLALVPADGTRFEKILDDFLKPIGDSLNALHALAKTLLDTFLKSDDEIAELANRVAAQSRFVQVQIRHEVDTQFWRLFDDLHNAAAALQSASSDFPKARIELKRLFHELIDGSDAVDGYADVLNQLPGTIADSAAQFERLLDHVDDVTEQMVSEIFAVEADIASLPPWPVTTPPEEVILALKNNADTTAELVRELEFALGEPSRQWLGNKLDTIRNDVRAALETVDLQARRLQYALLKNTSTSQDDIVAGLETLQESVASARDMAFGVIQDVIDALDGLSPASLSDLLNPVRAAIDAAIDAADTFDGFARASEAAFAAATAKLEGLVDAALATLLKDVQRQAGAIYNALFPDKGSLLTALATTASAQAVQAIVDLLRDLKTLTNAQVRGELQRLYDLLRRDVAELVNRLGTLIKIPAITEAIIGPDTLRLLRGFGEPPKVPHLDFNLPNCGYYFFDPESFKNKLAGIDLKSVRLSALAAQANQLASDALNAIEINLPTVELLDRLKPFDLSTFDLSRLFPNFAGLKLESLFPTLHAPSAANDHVKVTHGEDPQSRSGWIQVDVDFPITNPTTVLTVAGVTFRLVTARFQATARIDVVSGQAPRQVSHGAITGDWDIQIGGFPVAVLTSCALTFDNDGKIGFNVSPDRVKLQAVLAFLADLMSKFGYSDQGFSIVLTPEGIRTTLDLPLPDVQAGAFGIANLRLGFSFALNVVPFQITTSLSIARKTAPFTLTVFILGGAGWFEMGVRYLPASGEFDTFVNIGIAASASLAIALGPIRGGVYAYFGITVDYVASNKHPSRLAIGLFILFAGQVSLLGIISVSLQLGLEAQYTNGGGLIGRGFVNFTIKICWFITIDVHAAVEYRFGSASGSSESSSSMRALAASINPYDAAATEYVDMFA